MFINFKKGSINVSPITNFTAICDMETNIVTLTWDYIPVNKSSYSIATFCVMRDPFNDWDSLVDNECIGNANYDYNTPFNPDGKTKTATYVDKIPDNYTNNYTRYKICTRIDQNYYYTSDIVTVYINKSLSPYGQITTWLYKDGDECYDKTFGWQEHYNMIQRYTKDPDARTSGLVRFKDRLMIKDTGMHREERYVWNNDVPVNRNIFGWNETCNFLIISTSASTVLPYNKPQRLCVELTNYKAIDNNNDMFCRVVFTPNLSAHGMATFWTTTSPNSYANSCPRWLRYIYDSDNHKIENPNMNDGDIILLNESNCFNTTFTKKIFKANINTSYIDSNRWGNFVFLTYVPYNENNDINDDNDIQLEIHKVWLENQE